MEDYFRNDLIQLFKTAVTNRGNLFRIQKAIKKAEKDTATIAFLGGSVTYGYNPEGMIKDNYPELFCRYFRKRYCKGGDCICINKGLAATNSLLGLVITDISIKKACPDIVFVEYAINNGMDKVSISTYESLIYKLICLDSQPAVIPVIVCNADLYSCNGYMEVIARHYDLPVINLYHVIKQGLEVGIMSWGDYSNDYAHPTVSGHRMIAGGILQLFELIDINSDLKDFLPDTPCFGREFYTMEYYDISFAPFFKSGSFYGATTPEPFPLRWNYIKGTGNQSYEMSIECRSFCIIYEQSNNMEYGEIEILDENRIIGSINSYSIYGFLNPEIELIIREEAPKLYYIKIRMRKGDEGKKFSLLGFGVVR